MGYKLKQEFLKDGKIEKVTRIRKEKYTYVTSIPMIFKLFYGEIETVKIVKGRALFNQGGSKVGFNGGRLRWFMPYGTTDCIGSVKWTLIYDGFGLRTLFEVVND